MPTSEIADGHLQVRAPGARIDVLDAWLRPVPGAVASDDLDVPLAAGAYRVDARVGADLEHRLVLVRPGQVATVAIEVAFGASAPVAGTTTENEMHGYLADRLTGGGPGLTVVVRGLRDAEMAPLDVGIEVLDVDGRRVPIPDPARDSGDPATARAVGWTVPAGPGGYRLRWAVPGAEPMEQSVWVAPGWQTVLFVPQGPRGPVPALGSVHLLAAGSRFDPHDRRAWAIENALTALESGRPAPDGPRRTEDLRASDNPMLMLLTVHLLLRSPTRSAAVLDAVRTLDAVLGPHPDVLALVRHLGLRDAAGDWPPMLAVSLDLLLTAAAVPPGSLAEAVTGQRHAGGPLLLWDPSGLVTGGGGPAMSAPDRPGGAPVPPVALDRVRRVLDDVGHRIGASPAATAARLGPVEIGRRLGMAPGLVEACLAAIT